MTTWTGRYLGPRRRLALIALVLVAAGVASLLTLMRPAVQEPDEQLRRQIGQMLMVGFRGTTADGSWPRLLTRQIAAGEVGGVLLLGRNIGSLDDVRQLNRAFLAASGDLPPFIAVDQEGGRIERLGGSIGFPATPSARWLAANGDVSVAAGHYSAMAVGLRDLGFNVNFGPVVDLDLEPSNPIIGRLERAYASDAGVVTDFARTFVAAHRGAGLITSLKHFPGHGSSLVDSHRSLPDISASWSEIELEPYSRLIGEGLADMVMVGHLAVAPLTGSAERPSSLSPELVTGLLRGKLGYDGVIVSDDMDMGAITGAHGLEESLVAAIRAGIDLLIVSNFHRDDPQLPGRLVQAIGREAMRDPALRTMIEAASARIVALKQSRLATSAARAS